VGPWPPLSGSGCHGDLDRQPTSRPPHARHNGLSRPPGGQVFGPGRVELVVDLLFLRCLLQLLVFPDGHDRRYHLAVAADHVVVSPAGNSLMKVIVTTPIDSRAPQHGGPADSSSNDHRNTRHLTTLTPRFGIFRSRFRRRGRVFAPRDER